MHYIKYSLYFSLTCSSIFNVFLNKSIMKTFFNDSHHLNIYISKMYWSRNIIISLKCSYKNWRLILTFNITVTYSTDRVPCIVFSISWEIFFHKKKRHVLYLIYSNTYISNWINLRNLCQFQALKWSHTGLERHEGE